MTNGVQAGLHCPVCDADAAFLRGARPPYEALRPAIRLVDLFAGCGGLTLGAAEAARALALGIEVPLAVDVDPTAVEVYKANFPGAQVRCARVEDLFDGHSGEPATIGEAGVKQAVGPVDVLLGGPPCQGHSDLNNRTRRRDARNRLYALMARAAEVLEPTLVLIENVPTVTHDVGKVVDAARAHLRASEYIVAERVIDLSWLGVPQRRRRHVLLATRDQRVDVEAILDIGPRCPDHPVRSVRWAIGDLVRAEGEGIFDSPSAASTENARRIAWLFEHGKFDLPNRLRPKCHQSDHSYRSMYGRLRWEEPAQTVTTGFGSMGQGRYVHPSQQRTLTPHEAARLQMLPDFLDFSPATTRTGLARLIGNAVPPPLASLVLERALRSLGLAPAAAFPAVRGETRRRGGARDRAGVSASGRRRTGVPGPSSAEAHNRMTSVRQTGTAAERALQAEMNRLGLRYRVNERIAGTQWRADLLLDESGIVVMVDGCYWHGCPIHGTSPKTNAAWWQAKLAANRARDQAAARRLHEMGWIVLRFWEHDDPRRAALGVATMAATRRAAAEPRPGCVIPGSIT